MGMLVDGRWTDDDVPPGTGGAFQRPDSAFRDRVTRDGASGFKAEPGRYQLVTAPSCPWAHRAVIVRRLKRLESVLPLLESDLPKGQGWAYSRGFDDLAPVDGVFHVHQVYSAARAGYTGKATVPLLWDCRTRTIVNNESSEIIRMLNEAFDEWGDASVDLYPAPLRAEIDAVNEWVYAQVNNGVYRCGFAKSQAAYEAAYAALFEGLDRLEAMLARRRWLVGDRFTEADVRLFTTLVRFDLAYYGLFKCNRQRLVDFPALWSYTREIWQMPGVGETVDADAIKAGYWGGMPRLNPGGILPVGPAIDFAAPHDRARLPQRG